MSQDADLKQAIELIKAGKKSDALPIPKNILQANHNNEIGRAHV